jgi:hypothetical protein
MDCVAHDEADSVLKNCLEHAHKILRMFKACSLPQFRTTW